MIIVLLYNIVRKHGIIQFLNIFDKVKSNKNDILLWGDEVYSILLLDRIYYCKKR